MPTNKKLTKLIIPTILALVGLAILLNLGFWQLDRAEQKRQLISEMDTRKTQKPLTLAELDNNQDKSFYHVAITGELLADYALYLDNRIVSGRPGIEVIYPVKVGQRLVLVNRGWFPIPADRSILPTLPEQPAELNVTGVVYQPTEALVLKEDQLNADDPWPKLIQALDMEKLGALYNELGFSIEPWILRQDPTENSAFVQQWKYVNMLPERHVSYAVTWFGLAIALMIIYISALLLKKEKPLGKQST